MLQTKKQHLHNGLTNGGFFGFIAINNVGRELFKMSSTYHERGSTITECFDGTVYTIRFFTRSSNGWRGSLQVRVNEQLREPTCENCQGRTDGNLLYIQLGAFALHKGSITKYTLCDKFCTFTISQ